MRKSLVKWLRKFVLMGLASASLLSSNCIFAHDLPIFDSLSPINCFGIGSCGFPINVKIFEEAPSIGSGYSADFDHQTDLAGGIDGFGWSFAECFDNYCPDPLGQATLGPNALGQTALGQGTLPPATIGQGSPEIVDTEIAAIEAEELDGSCEGDYSSEDSAAGESRVSFPVSSLSLIQALGIQIPKFDLNQTIADFSSVVWDQVSRTEFAAPPASDSENNYLLSRPLVDDYLAGESFVRDWRADHSYRGLNRLDFHQNNLLTTTEDSDEHPLAVAIPKRPKADPSDAVIAALNKFDEFQCIVSQELRDFHISADFAAKSGTYLAGWDLKANAALNLTTSVFAEWAAEQPIRTGNAEFAQLDELFGQPSFVIYRLEGKELLLPAKQARHWNSVPSFPTKIASNATADRPILSHESAAPVMVIQLANTASTGLEMLAAKLQQIAENLRYVAKEVSQVAARAEVDGIR